MMNRILSGILALASMVTLSWVALAQSTGPYGGQQGSIPLYPAQPAGMVFAAPCAADGPPVFRALCAADVAPLGITPAPTFSYLSTNVPFASAVSTVDTVPKDILTLALTAGEWQCTASAWTKPSTSTLFIAGINGTANTLPTAPNGNGMAQTGEGAATAAGVVRALNLGPMRQTVTTPRTLHLVAQVNFSVGGEVYGFLGCLKVS